MPFQKRNILDRSRSGKPVYYTYEKPASKPGNDPTAIRATIDTTVENCVLELPNGCHLEHMTEVEGRPGEYWHTALTGGLHVHVRGAKDAKPGDKLVGKAVIFLRSWEPKGAADKKDGKTRHRNYTWCVDFFPSDDVTPTKRLHISNTASANYTRSSKDIVSSTEWAHLSGERDPSKVRDQHMVLLDINSPVRKGGNGSRLVTSTGPKSDTGETAMSAALKASGIDLAELATGGHTSA